MELLDPFVYLPYDKMYEICEKLDDRSLGQIMRTSKKARETCQNIFNQRKQKYEAYQSQINFLVDLIKNTTVIVFKKKIGNITITIEISSRTSRDVFSIQQIINGASNTKEIKNIPWPLPGVIYSQINSTSTMSNNIIQNRYSERINKSDFYILDLAKFIIEQDYILM